MTKKKKVTTTVTVTEEVVTSGEKTQIICILDRSGSMSFNNVIIEARNGFNNFLKDQKKLSDDASLTVALFDDKYELLYDDVDLKDVKKITEKEWSPRGTTALYDAIGKTINTARANHKKKGNKPDKVLCCIVTDGLENASQEYNHSEIKKLIKKCEKDDWNFMYLAANQDAFDVGTGFGVSGGNTYTFTATMDGAAKMSNIMNNASVMYRSMSKTDANYSVASKNLVVDDEDDSVISSTGTVTFNNSTTTADTEDEKE